MERAIRVISVERGYDPREFTLFAFGGAGGMHAAYLARQLSIPQVFVPKTPGILSAIGMLMADVIKDYSQTVMCMADSVQGADMENYLDPLREQAVQNLVEEGIARSNVALEAFLDMRYEGQSYEIITPFTADFIDAFHQLHEKTYGYRNDRPVQIVNVRLRARGVPQKPTFAKIGQGGEAPADASYLGNQKAIFEGNAIDTPIFQRESLLAGNVIGGPAIIVEYSSTIIIPPFTAAKVDPYGNIVMNIEPEKEKI